jgi:hydroxymethylbilane synthase
MKTLIIGTRGSKLALWQAHWIVERLGELGRQTRIEIIKTTGDKIFDAPLAQVGAASGTKGVFTKEIEEALLAGEIDLAVHSLKDLPTELPDGLGLGMVPQRADARDAIVGRTPAELECGARVGTSSLRRAAQLRRLRPDLEIGDIRGNVDTRLRKLDEGQFEAILLASAGLHRLGLQDRIAEILEPSTMAPAIGQGALGVEIRTGDDEVAAALAPLEHAATRLAVTAERSLLEALGGGCQVPLGGYAEVEGDRLQLRAVVVSADGERLIEGAGSGAAGEAARIGRDTAKLLLERGAAQLIADC